MLKDPKNVAAHQKFKAMSDAHDQKIAEQIINRIDNPKDSELTDYIGLEHIESNNLKISKYGRADDVVSSKFVCGKGDIIFGRRRAYLRKLAISDRSALVSTDAMVIRPKEKFSKEFLILTMQTDKFWDEVISRSAGSLSPRIKWRDLSSIEVLLPPLKVQEKISKLVFSLQDNIEKTENLIQVAEKLKKGLLEELLTKGIGHKKFKKTELGEIPADWFVQKLSDACEINMGQSPPSSSYNSIGKGLPFIQGKADFGKEHPNITIYTNSPAKLAKSGDILFTVRAPVGAMNWCNKETCIGRGVAAFRPRKNTDTLFLYYTLERLNYELNRLSQGSTFTAINGKELKVFKIASVPLEEQEKIGKILNDCDKEDP